MGFFDNPIKQDSGTLGCMLFYTTAMLLILIFNRDNIIDNVIDNNDVIIKETTSIVNNDIVIEDNSSNNNNTISNTTTPNTSPIKIPSTSTTTTTRFKDIIKQGIPIIRIKGKKKKNKIIIMNNNKISIRATNNFLSSIKIKEFSVQSIDTITINDNNDNISFNLMIKNGTVISKYELLTESKSQCEYIVNGLLALKQEEKEDKEVIH